MDCGTKPALHHYTLPHSQVIPAVLKAAHINLDTNSDFKCKSTHYIPVQRSCDKKAI